MSRCLELISDFRSYVWAQFRAERAANWYHTVPIQMVTYPGPEELFAGMRMQGIVDIKTGVLRAAAAAKLQRDAGRGQIIVDPSEYFAVLMGALSHAIFIIKRLEEEDKFGEKSLNILIAMASRLGD